MYKIPIHLLYAAVKLEFAFTKAGEKNLSRKGTGFFVLNKKEEIFLVTNRHLVDLSYELEASKPNKFLGFKLNHVYIYAKKQDKETGQMSINQEFLAPYCPFPLPDFFYCADDVVVLAGSAGR